MPHEPPASAQGQRRRTASTPASRPPKPPHQASDALAFVPGEQIPLLGVALEALPAFSPSSVGQDEPVPLYVREFPATADSAPLLMLGGLPGSGGTPSIGVRWGEFPPQDRQAVLARRLQQWAAPPDHHEGTGPFAGVSLTGADVFWLAMRLLAQQAEGTAPDDLFTPPLRGLADLHLEGANLAGGHLTGADLSEVQLQGANFIGAHLEEAILSKAQLQGATLTDAYLEDALLIEAHLQGANLAGAHLDNANFYGARLEQADLSEAHLQGAVLSEAHLAGTDFTQADLRQVDLRAATLDVQTRLIDVVLDANIHVADTTWNGVPLIQVEWGQVPRVGDEVEARQKTDIDGVRKPARQRFREFQAAARTYRQLVVALRGQGQNEVADRFAFRAQVMQRKVLWWQLRLHPFRKLSSYAFSWLLAALTGYGFRMWRILIAYGLLVLSFAGAYWSLDRQLPHALTFWQALIVSLTAFHGRVFSYNPFTLSNPQIVVTAVEAICGLVIEGVFIAMLTQRFFNR